MLGRGIFALGCSSEAARRAGFNIWKTHLFIYIYMGILGALYGMLSISVVNACNPVSMVGEELGIIAAVIIGGAKATGGHGTIFGTVLGVTIMYLFSQTLVFMGLSSSWNDLFLGARSAFQHYRNVLSGEEKEQKYVHFYRIGQRIKIESEE